MSVIRRFNSVKKAITQSITRPYRFHKKSHLFRPFYFLVSTRSTFFTYRHEQNKKHFKTNSLSQTHKTLGQ